MKHLLLAAALALGAGCTEVANPRSCIDGSCTDSRFPYCDIEGLIETPQTCIAVECSPGEFKACRDDRAITCNPTGNNFDLVECPFGCNENGCIPPEEIDCTTNAECTNPAPICGAEMSCRGCVNNDECASTVCELDTGACTAETAIVYASPTGSTTTDCTLAEPCTLARATMLATVAIGKTLRLLPGTYTTNFDIAGNVIVKVVATGATIANTVSMRISGGATVDVRDLVITPGSGVQGQLDCGDQSVAVARSTLRWSGVDARLRMFRCNVTMVGGTLRALSMLSDESSLDADRVTVTPQFTSIAGQRQSVRFMNSVFEDVSMTLGTSDPDGSQGSTLTVGFSTFVYAQASTYFICNTNALMNERTQHFENNIFLATPSVGSSTSVFPRDCTFANNIMFPQSTPIAGNPVVDPKLVDVAAKNYRLMSDSPALNTAIVSAGISTSHDFDNVSRPQGAAPDIGAFERTP
jgi:hypothetical protein